MVPGRCVVQSGYSPLRGDCEKMKRRCSSAGEQLSCNQQVVGSNPTRGSKRGWPTPSPRDYLLTGSRERPATRREWAVSAPGTIRRCSSMVELLPSKQETRVRFPSPAPWDRCSRSPPFSLFFPLTARNRREVPGRNAATFRPGANQTRSCSSAGRATDF